MALGEIYVVIVGFSNYWYLRIHSIIGKSEFFIVFPRFLWHKVEYYLSYLADFENSFTLTYFEAVWDSDLPLGGLLSNVSDHDGLLSLELDARAHLPLKIH